MLPASTAPPAGRRGDKALDASYHPQHGAGYEPERGAIWGVPPRWGTLSSVDAAVDMICVYVLLNDWPAHGIQTWEYQPLGPSQSKAFATSKASGTASGSVRARASSICHRNRSHDTRLRRNRRGTSRCRQAHLKTCRSLSGDDQAFLRANTLHKYDRACHVDAWLALKKETLSLLCLPVWRKSAAPSLIRRLPTLQ